MQLFAHSRLFSRLAAAAPLVVALTGCVAPSDGHGDEPGTIEQRVELPSLSSIVTSLAQSALGAVAKEGVTRIFPGAVYDEAKLLADIDATVRRDLLQQYFQGKNDDVKGILITLGDLDGNKRRIGQPGGKPAEEVYANYNGMLTTGAGVNAILGATGPGTDVDRQKSALEVYVAAAQEKVTILSSMIEIRPATAVSDKETLTHHLQSAIDYASATEASVRADRVQHRLDAIGPCELRIIGRAHTFQYTDDGVVHRFGGASSPSCSTARDGAVQRRRSEVLADNVTKFADMDRTISLWRNTLSALQPVPADVVRYGVVYTLQNGWNNWGGGFLDTRGRNCAGNDLCVSTAVSDNRDTQSGHWLILSADGKEAGAPVMANDHIFLLNQYLNGGFLDTRGAGCEDNELCVSTAFGSARDGKSGEWTLSLDTGGAGFVVRGAAIRLRNDYSHQDGFGGYLDTRYAGCADNLLCVSTSRAQVRDGASTQWRIQLPSN